MKYVLSLLALTLTLLLNGCGSSGSSSTSPEPTLQSIEITPAFSEIDINATQRFKAYGFYSDLSQKDITDTVIWSLENNSSIIIPVKDTLSYARAVKVGTDHIVATLDTISANAAVEVLNGPPPVSMRIVPTVDRVQVGAKKRYQAIGIYADGFEQDLSDESNWSSADVSVADVDNENDILAKNPGTTSILASYRGVTASMQLTVDKEPAIEYLTISPNPHFMLVDSQQSFSAYAHYDNGFVDIVTDEVHWYPTNGEDYALVKFDLYDENTLTALKEGNASITADLNHKLQATATIEIEKEKIRRIQIYPKALDIKVNQSLMVLTEAVLDSNGQILEIDKSNNGLRYSVNDEAVARVSNVAASKGHVTALAEGTAILTSTFIYEGETFTDEINITVTQ